MNQFEVLATDAEPAMNESEVFRFSSLVPDARVTLQEKKPDSDEYDRFDVGRYPPTVSLLVCSSKYGYYVAATLEGFAFGSTKALRDTIKALEKGSTGPLNDKVLVPIAEGPVHQLRISADQSQIIVAVAGGWILTYNAKDIFNQKENTKPVASFQLESDVLDLRPNPDVMPELAAVILKDNTCKLIDLRSGSTTVTLGDDITAVCWSPKGKQLVCGRKNGQFVPFDVEGSQKTVIELPEELQNNDPPPYVLGLLWIQPNVFLVVYGKSEGADEVDPSHVAYIVDRKSRTTGGLQYILLDDVTGVFGDERGPKMFMELIPNFSSDMKYAAILGNAASTDFSVVGQDENGDWATYILPENGLAIMPLSDNDMDTYPVGMALDFSVSEELPPYDPSVDTEGVKPLPALYYLNDEDHMGAYYCFQETLAKNGAKYTGMVNAEDVQTAAVPEPSSSTTSTTTTNVKESIQDQEEPALTAAATQTPGQQQELESTEQKNNVPSNFSSSPFGAALQQQGDNTNSGFGSFGSPTTSGNTSGGFGGSSFTSFRNLGTATPTSSIQAPKFGSSTIGAPAFGSTSFGQPPGDAPVQQQSFASLAKKTTPTAAAPSNLMGSGSLFGGAGGSSSTPTFGSSSFGATSETPASSTQNQSFADLAKQSKPGAFGTAISTTPSLGSTGFGQTSFGQTAFGSAPASSTLGSGGFASLAKQPNAPSKIPVPSSNSFGSGSSFGNTSPFAKTTTSTPTFGSTTSFGATPPSEKPAAAAPEKSVEPTPTPTPSASEKDTTLKEPVAAVKEEESETDKLPAQPVVEREQDEKEKEEPTIKEEAQEEKKPGFGGFGAFGSAQKEQGKPGVSTSIGFGSFGSALASAAATTTTSTPTTAPKSDLLGSSTTATASPTVTASTEGFFGKAATPSPASSETITAKAEEPAPQKASTSLFAGMSSKPSAPEAKPAASTSLFSGLSAPSTQEQPPKTTTAGWTFGDGSAASPAAPSTLSKPVEPVAAAAKQTSTFPTSSPASTSKPSTATTATNAPSQPEPPKDAKVEPEMPKLTAKDGMAQEFERAYHTINIALKKLAMRQDELATQIQQQQKQRPSAKGMRDLGESLESWRIADAQDIAGIIETIVQQAKEIEPQITELSKSIEYFQDDLEKLEAKNKVIGELKDKESDPVLEKELNKRGLDQEVAKKWDRIQSRTKEYGDLLSDLENKIHDAKKRNRSPITPAHDAKPLSLYALHVVLRDIESKLRSKHDQLREIESRLARLHFKDTHAKASKSSRRITFDDDDSSDEDEVNQEKEKEPATASEGKPWSQPVVDYTMKHLRRERFLDKLHHFQQYQEYTTIVNN
ncbi:hypothetical protein BDB00DRAFT_813821 [Zychaea mexicana]|uniref:uncharacterized protein n=1 Tax=Zychaea mexicana TaxID=64656 RepID=UPI0022FDEF01|nr:uncharacterized protein BDB00DRAFT_813821 [Zychaea mexicana]KAI9495562.1 hypothetical protein BDB00DRAFT_813821 [Zychaea mexicana]